MNVFMKKKTTIISIILTAGIGLLAGVFIGFKSSDNDYFFKINKSIDIFGKVYKEVALNYVDEVEPDKFMESGIDGLLSTLDPYTNYLNEESGGEVELMTSGKYGGIGVTIGVRDGYITILSLIEGYSAQRQGLQPGDRILEIEGKSAIGIKPDAVRGMTRGEPGTVVHLKIEREDEKAPLSFVLVREEIQLKNITFADYLGNGVGYVHLERFSRGAADELRLAIKDLKLRGTLKGLIFDLRDNPGGLLDEAVDIVEKFVPKGSLVVSTRGRKPESERKYFAAEEPMLADVPLIVLVNHNSASASEIVAGAMQDLDRGVILGARTFGKGLVQTIVPLVYDTQLKMTTAKYYTPSGRCIQEIDYSHKNLDGVFSTMPDSARREFKTTTGRTVYELGGIRPDSTVEETKYNAFYNELLRKSVFFKFATRYVTQHNDTSQVLQSDEQLSKNFEQFLKEQQFSYQDEGEKKLVELKEVADKSKYSATVLEEINRLKVQIQEEKKHDFERDKTTLLREIKTEIMGRYKGTQGKIAASLEGDQTVEVAKRVLQNEKVYNKLLGIKKGK